MADTDIVIVAKRIQKQAMAFLLSLEEGAKGRDEPSTNDVEGENSNTKKRKRDRSHPTNIGGFGMHCLT